MWSYDTTRNIPSGRHLLLEFLKVIFCLWNFECFVSSNVSFVSMVIFPCIHGDVSPVSMVIFPLYPWWCFPCNGNGKYVERRFFCFFSLFQGSYFMWHGLFVRKMVGTLGRDIALINTCLLSCLFSTVQFHLGHLHHLCGEYKLARQSFEWILASKNVPNEIKALSLRQLGEKRMWGIEIIVSIENKCFVYFFF